MLWCDGLVGGSRKWKTADSDLDDSDVLSMNSELVCKLFLML